MNSFEQLPLEILKQIFLLLERKTIKYLHHVLINAVKIDLQELLDLRRFVAYPRPDGHCNTYFIPKSLITLEDKGCIPNNHPILFMEYFDSINADIVKGDVIRTVSDLIINLMFDSKKIVNLDYSNHVFGTIPKIFHVIENDVPIKYWHDSVDEPGIYGIDDTVWFDHRSVVDQCLANIEYGVVEEDEDIIVEDENENYTIKNNKYGIFTTFIYNAKTYKIIYDYTESADYMAMSTYEFLEDKEKDGYMEEFRRDLLDDNEIAFKYEVNSYRNDKNNILFMTW